MMGWYGGGMGAGAWVVMGVFWIALLAGIIFLVVRLLPSNAHTGAPSVTPQSAQRPVQESALDILDRRFAQGDITLETYQAHRAALIAARGGR
jgi:putative membrane protein